MKILITGSNGFLGTAVVERLLVHGHRDLRCFVRPGSQRARLEAITAKFPDAKVEIFVGSLGSKEGAAAAIEGVDLILHLAAAMNGAAADMSLGTVVASKNLLEAIVARKPLLKVVLVSSFGVYGVGGLPKGHLVDETPPLEPHPERRDLYSQTKLRQDKLFQEYRDKHGVPVVILRPGVIYGPGGSAFSSRVGVNLFGVFLHLGRSNILPLTYVDNCAEAIVVAAFRDDANGQAFNVVDDDLPTCKQYLEGYKRNVRPIRSVSLPYAATQALSVLVEKYHAYSKGQLPAIFTPYKTATSWQGNRFENRKLKGLGWQPLVSTTEGLRRTFEYLKAHGK